MNTVIYAIKYVASARHRLNFNIVRCPCNGLCLVKRHLNLYIDITLHYITSTILVFPVEQSVCCVGVSVCPDSNFFERNDHRTTR